MTASFRKLALVSALSAAFALPAAVEAAPTQVSLGGALYVTSSEYVDTDPVYYPLPALTVESDRFWVHGVSGGVYLFKNEAHSVRLGLGWMPMFFDPDDSDDARMQTLKKRDSSMAASVGYRWTSRFGIVDASMHVDVLGKSDGILMIGSYRYPVRLGDLTLVPFTTLTWASENFNDYYYGVSNAESRRSGFNAYSPDAALTPAFGMDVDYALGANWSLFGTASATLIPSEVKDSPIVEDDVKWVVGAGVRYNF